MKWVNEPFVLWNLRLRRYCNDEEALPTGRVSSSLDQWCLKKVHITGLGWVDSRAVNIEIYVQKTGGCGADVVYNWLNESVVHLFLHCSIALEVWKNVTTASSELYPSLFITDSTEEWLVAWPRKHELKITVSQCYNSDDMEEPE
ncbi:hypothetical protein FRX31_024483 [Thalictrum thalictroides]|uniref:Reverse transcriptase zinc-binding domain-containing protein n=1 Tax=Thalictrum thalictroides TaxID=46969 RepID=A0A7J6VP36_THATH|nr:hypothetical protein FRX31_024483 [Thalictrum thalictroides]